MIMEMSVVAIRMMSVASVVTDGIVLRTTSMCTIHIRSTPILGMMLMIIPSTQVKEFRITHRIQPILWSQHPFPEIPVIAGNEWRWISTKMFKTIC